MTRPSLKLVTAPTIKVVELADAKAHLRIDSAAEDVVLQTILDTAISILDGPYGELGRALLVQEWEQSQYCAHRDIELIVPPFRALTEIRYLDPDHVEQTADISDFSTTTYPDGFAMVSPKPGKVWPVMAKKGDALRIRYTAGVDSAEEVPNQIKHAVRLLFGHLDKEREATTVADLKEIPIGVARLVEPFRSQWVA